MKLKFIIQLKISAAGKYLNSEQKIGWGSHGCSDLRAPSVHPLSMNSYQCISNELSAMGVGQNGVEDAGGQCD